MKIIDTFAIKAPHLFAVQYENEKFNEWRRLFKMWNDVEYLRNFFENNIQDLQYGYYKKDKYTIEQAIEVTIETSHFMERDLKKFASGDGYTLDSKFKPLDDTNFNELAYEMDKSKQKWLRIYAIRVEANFYVVSGGGIKLVHRMQDCEHLQKELQKLIITQNYLQSE
jgi:hypothetical protein